MGGALKMKGETVHLEIPLEVIEHVFRVLSIIKPTMVTKLEKKALDLLKDQIYYELEVYIESPEDAEQRRLKFKELFEEARNKKMNIEQEEKAY